MVFSKGNSLKLIKIDDEQKVVYGWASVISEKGKPFVDSQDDVIEPHELIAATTDFMLESRASMLMHDTNKMVGQVVHSFPLVKELSDSLGINSEREGWIVGVKVYNLKVWDSIKSGKISGFSIGGRAERQEINAN